MFALATRDVLTPVTQPHSVNGSPDTIVSRGVHSGAFALDQWIARLLEQLDRARSPDGLRAVLGRADQIPGLEKFANAIAESAEHSAALGILDVEWEIDNDKAVAVETFTELHGARLLKVESPFAGQPYKAAIEQFEQRLPVTRDVWDRMKATERQRAFTIAGAARNQVVKKAQHEILRQLELGADLRDFRDRVKERLETAGFTPQNPSHVETIFRTNVLGAYNRGRYTEMSQPDIVAARPYWQVLGANDGRSRATHKRVHGWVLRADDPFWSTKGGPPWGYNCRCRVRSLSGAQLEKRGVRVHVGTEMTDLPDPGFQAQIIAPPAPSSTTRTPRPQTGQPVQPPPRRVPAKQKTPHKRPVELPALPFDDRKRPVPRPFANAQEHPAEYTPQQRTAIGSYMQSDVEKVAGAIARGRQPPAKAQAAMRDKTRELIAEHGFDSVDTAEARAAAKSIKRLRDPNARGTHSWTGQVQLQAHVIDDAAQCLNALKSGLAPAHRQADGLRTVVHEELHGASRIAPTAYRGGGVVLEEALTEFAARRVVNTVIGEKRFGPLSFGSYETYRREVFGAVQRAYRRAGFDPPEDMIFNRIHHATRTIRGPRSTETLHTPEAHAQAFSRALAGLPKEAQDRLVSDLLDLRP